MRVLIAAALAAGGLLLGAPAGAAECGGPTDGDDVICLAPGDIRVGSPGNDTYLLLEGEGPAVVLEGGEYEENLRLSLAGLPGRAEANDDDPGFDTLSFELWQSPLVHERPTIGSERLATAEDLERMMLTPFNDVVGGTGCHNMTTNGFVINAGLGDDLLQCLAGELHGGGGADVLYHVGAGSVIKTGTGADLFIADGLEDTVKLGRGGDCAVVRRGDVDTVYGGQGVDEVVASPNDELTSGQDVPMTEVTEPSEPCGGEIADSIF